jgi:nucleotide-binding universal stress UspA family protein
MSCVLACIDTSSYANSVCDHAAWFAGRIDAHIEILHVTEGPSTGGRGVNDLVVGAVRRLRDEGAPAAEGREAAGSFVETAVGRGADLVVMGKRGASGERDRRALGSRVDAMIRAAAVPVCLTSKVFLPIARAVVLLDADMGHRTAVELVASHAGLHRLDIDLVIVARQGEDPSPKLQWARAMLAARDADIFSMRADGPDDAATKYMEQHGADLVVISRAVLLPDPTARLGRIEERGLWGSRTPVLVC